jgi:chorismate dehydratase
MIRIATVGYLNARPLTSRLDPSRYTIRSGHPFEVAEWLASGAVDLALVPIGAVLDHARAVRLVPGVCIGALGPVRSVVLAGSAPPHAWRRVYLDGVSRTSVLLARLLLAGPLAGRVGAGLEVVDAPPGRALELAGSTDGALVIGDAALALDVSLVRFDLAAEWTAWTSLPFVFAAWAGRPDLPTSVVADVAAAGRAGVAAIADDHDGAARDYLLGNLRYALDDAAMMGLRRFAASAARAGLVAGPAEVHLYPPDRSLPGAPAAAAAVARALAGAPVDAAELAGAALSDLVAAAAVRVGGRPLRVQVVLMLPADLDAGRRGALIAAAVAAGAVGARVEGRVDLAVAAVAALPEAWRSGVPGRVVDAGADAVGTVREVAVARLTLPPEEEVVVVLSSEDAEICAAALHAGADVLEVRLDADPLGWSDRLAVAARVVRDAGRPAVGLPAIDARKVARRIVG